MVALSLCLWLCPFRALPAWSAVYVYVYVYVIYTTLLTSTGKLWLTVVYSCMCTRCNIVSCDILTILSADADVR